MSRCLPKSCARCWRGWAARNLEGRKNPTCARFLRRRACRSKRLAGYSLTFVARSCMIDTAAISSGTSGTSEGWSSQRIRLPDESPRLRVSTLSWHAKSKRSPGEDQGTLYKPVALLGAAAPRRHRDCGRGGHNGGAGSSREHSRFCIHSRLCIHEIAFGIGSVC